MVVQLADGGPRRFAESPEIVENGGAAGITAVERVVGFGIPQTVVVNLRTGLAIQIGIAPYHGAVVGEKSSECERVITNQKGRIVAVIRRAQDETAHRRFNVHHDGIVAIVGNDRGIGRAWCLVGIPVGSHAPITTSGICPNDAGSMD